MSKTFGAGIIAIDKSTGHILMGRRNLNSKDGNTWAPFGGTFDTNDKIPKLTAIREFKEETGCNVDYMISKKPFYINDDNHLKFYNYLGLFDSKFTVKLNSETLEHEWFDINHLPENLHPGVKEMIENKNNDLKYLINRLSCH